MFLTALGVTGVVRNRLGATSNSEHPRADVYIPLHDKAITVYEAALQPLASSADAKRLGAGGAYAPGYVECISWPHRHWYWEVRRHLDVLLVDLLAPNLGRASARPGRLVVWSIGVGLGVNFFVAQYVLIPPLAAAVGAAVSLDFVGFEIGSNVKIAARVVDTTKHSTTRAEVRNDILSFVLATMAFVDDISISLPAPRQLCGRRRASTIRSQPLRGVCGPAAAQRVRAQQCGRHLHSVRAGAHLVGPRGRGGRQGEPLRLVHIRDERQLARVRCPRCPRHCRMFRCALGQRTVYAHVEDCANTSAMTGMCWFISSAPLAPAAASPRTPTLQRILAGYLSGVESAGCKYVASTAQREQLGRLLAGFYASSVTTAPGCGVSVGKAARWTKYRVQVECVLTN